MPKRNDIHKILLVGSGPIVIGQGCEFDYSGTQACKALKEEGYAVILVNSNPATVMTDPQFADRTYIEPITPEVVERIIERERPDALLPTMGGQTALNIAVDLSRRGVLEKYGVTLIGAAYESIEMAEDREKFKEAMKRIGLDLPAGGFANNLVEALRVVDKIGFPAIIRPSFTLGGTGGSVAYNIEEFKQAVETGLDASPIREILIEESILGWKEYELEVMRDLADNVVIICSIENVDAMGVHTGDSITVAPAQTLTDREYQTMRDASIRIIREIGVDTGGANVQFAVHPQNGRMVVIEMNPRVSRSSALASKATGFPIARIAAKLAVGFTLDEIRNDITQVTPASFEPTLDYVVVKFPRFSFEKFPQADQTLTTQMKSVGEVMAIGRTFKEALQKAVRSLETGRAGLESMFPEGISGSQNDLEILKEKLKLPGADRLFYLADALRSGFLIPEIQELSGWDPWFIRQVQGIVEMETALRKSPDLPTGLIRQAKQIGFSDARIGQIMGLPESEVGRIREAAGLLPVFKRVDTCAAEFEAYTPYLYSTYESECESEPTDRKKILILGSGPNRIGQGIEFDYCCVHASFALKEEGYETIMVNCNPETVSTDFDTSDRLYFEPLTREDVLNIIRVEKPEGVIVQFGGQTPLKLAIPLEEAGVRILGTSPEAIDRAEDRERFRDLLKKLGLTQPESGIARSADEARRVAAGIGYPVLVRPSYVLGGRAMEIVYEESSLVDYMDRRLRSPAARSVLPILIDKYLEDAVEIDVDALCDGSDVVIGGIMEHIEEAGVHSGDSACSLPPFSLDATTMDELRAQTHALAREIGVVGLMNVQFAIKNGMIYVLEVNPRASRTIPFVSKAIGLPLAQMAAKVMGGRKLRDLGLDSERIPHHVSVKEAVFPFSRFPGVDTLLGPEMKSTGEVMGIDLDFGFAFAKSQSGAGSAVPLSGKAFVSVKDRDKAAAVDLVKKLLTLGFEVEATRGTLEFLRKHGIAVLPVNKVAEGRPHIVDHLKNKEIAVVVNTVGDKKAQQDSFQIRRTALMYGIPYYTTIAGARAAVRGIEAMVQKGEMGLQVKCLQEYHRNNVKNAWGKQP